jgi:hypothetical protein
LLTTRRGHIAIGICCLYSSIQNRSEAIGSSEADSGPKGAEHGLD